MTVVYQREALASARCEIEATLPAMWAEMADGFREDAANPRWDIYEQAEAKGAAFLLTAREEGVLVGYFGMLVYPNLSLKRELAAASTPYYVVPRRDRGLILRSLIRHALALVQTRGVHKATVKTHPWASAETVLEHLNGRLVEKIYLFDLEQGAQQVASG
jgi:hypothetical protein